MEKLGDGNPRCRRTREQSTGYPKVSSIRKILLIFLPRCSNRLLRAAPAAKDPDKGKPYGH
jgi:hypothetical protein